MRQLFSAASYVLGLGTLLIAFQNCAPKNLVEERAPDSIITQEDLSGEDLPVMAMDATAVDAGPDLFEPGYGSCDVAKAHPRVDSKLALNVKDFGAIGDGKSHLLKSLSPDERARLAPSIELLNSVLLPLSPTGVSKKIEPGKMWKVTEEDEVDWIAIQAALVAAKRNNGALVLIPASTGDYLINRAVWLYSNVTFKWTGENFLRMTKAGGGSVITNINQFDRDDVARAYDDQVCNITIINPHIDAGGADGVYGQNGISFVNGSERISINGGHIKNAKWGSKKLLATATEVNAQGGRAMQFEAGVKDITVYGTKITNSSIGFSSIAANCVYSRIDMVDGKPKVLCNQSGGTVDIQLPKNTAGTTWPKEKTFKPIAWGIKIGKVTVDGSAMPFLFANYLYGMKDANGASLFPTEQVQKIDVDVFTVKNSGYFDADLAADFNLKTADSALFSLAGTTNFRAANGTFTTSAANAGSAIVRAFGDGLTLENVKIVGPCKKLIDTSGIIGARREPKPVLTGYSATRVVHSCK